MSVRQQARQQRGQQQAPRGDRRDGTVREVLGDVWQEARDRRAQLAAGVAYAVLLAGVLYLFSAVGADSGDWYDVTRRTTLAAVGVGLLVGGVLLGGLALLVDADVRRRTRPGAVPRHLRSRRRVVAAMGAGALLAAVGVAALLGWG